MYDQIKQTTWYELFAELFVHDDEWTDILGQYDKGKEQIKKLHEYPFKSVLKDV